MQFYPKDLCKVVTKDQPQPTLFGAPPEQVQLQLILIRAEETITPRQGRVVTQDRLQLILIRAERQITNTRQQEVSRHRPCPLVYLQ